MTIQLSNPSKFYQLRVYGQTRARNSISSSVTPTAAHTPHETREDLLKRGAAITMKATRISTKFGAEVREVPTPLWQAEGSDSLAHWVTEATEHYTRATQSPTPTVPSVQRIVDEWRALAPLQSVPPGGTALLPLEEHTRLVIASPDDEVALQISNTDSARTLRLRTLDTATGETAHVAFIPPMRDYAHAALVVANGKTQACIEQMPS